MQVTTAFKRGWLRRVYRGITTNLLAALNTANDSASTSAGSSGGTIQSVSANGRSTTLASPNAFTVSSQDIADMSAEMLDLYDTAKADLVAAGNLSPTDAAIYAQMLSHLRAAWTSTPDFSTALLSGR